MSNFVNFQFVRGNDFIKFIDGKIEYSTPEVQALWEDLVRKEENCESGPHGDYWAQLDITYEGFVGQSL